MRHTILFLLSPVFFGWLYLLLGETFNWSKKRDKEKGFEKTEVLFHRGRN